MTHESPEQVERTTVELRFGECLVQGPIEAPGQGLDPLDDPLGQRVHIGDLVRPALEHLVEMIEFFASVHGFHVRSVAFDMLDVKSLNPIPLDIKTYCPYSAYITRDQDSLDQESTSREKEVLEMTSWYAMEVEAERRREVISQSRFSNGRVAPTGPTTHAWDGILAKAPVGLRLAGVVGIAVALLSQIS